MGVEDKKALAAAAAVIETLWQEKVTETGKEIPPAASLWALGGRIAQMASHGPPMIFRGMPGRLIFPGK